MQRKGAATILPLDHPCVMAAMRRAVRRALLEHKLLGYPICEWRDGRVVWIAPEDIDVPVLRRCIRAITNDSRLRNHRTRRRPR